MKSSQKFALAAATTLTSVQALATPGHDHASAASMLTHVMFYGSAVVALVVVAAVSVKFFKKSK